MQFSHKKKILLIPVIASLCTMQASFASLVVIGNPHIQVSQLTQSQLSAIYLGKPVSLSTKEQLTPYDETSDSPLYTQFYQSIVGWGPSQLESYRSSLVFTGQSGVPTQVADDNAAIQSVETTPGAIAYVDSSSLSHVGNQIKVLYGNYTPPPVMTNNPYFHSAYSGNLKPTANSFYHVAAESDNIAPVTPQNNNDTNNTGQNTQQQVQGLVQQLAQNTSPTTSSTSNQDGSQNVWSLIQSQLQLGSDINNDRVQAQIRYLVHNPGVFNSIANSATPFIYYVYQQTQLRNMPALFALLPMIESGYKPNNYSSAGAEGLWQLMPGTASSYGLDIDWWYDGCRDAVASTAASLNFLVLLHQNLGDWYLAAAAYDAGQGAVQAAMNYNKRWGRGTDFWDLPLSKETRDYVPELLAFAAIVKDPARYGFTLPNVPNRPFFVAFKMNSQLDMEEISKLANISVPLVQVLNSGMRRYATAADATYTLLIPATNAETFRNNLAHVVGKEHWSWQYHEVHRNETLEDIAKNYHTNIGIIEKANGLTSDQVNPNEDLVVPIWLGKSYHNPLGMIDLSNQVEKLPPLPPSLLQNNTLVTTPAAQASVAAPAPASEIGFIKQAANVSATTPVAEQNNFTLNNNSNANANANSDTNSNFNSLSQQPISSNDNLKTLIAKVYGHD